MKEEVSGTTERNVTAGQSTWQRLSMMSVEGHASHASDHASDRGEGEKWIHVDIYIYYHQKKP